jgi:hypothetical protein
MPAELESSFGSATYHNTAIQYYKSTADDFYIHKNGLHGIKRAESYGLGTKCRLPRDETHVKYAPN